MEWTYLQCVVPEFEERFHLVEKALAEHFIPALFDELGDDAKMKAMRPLFALPCRNGGLDIPNPQKTATEYHGNSRNLTKEITYSLLHGTDLNVGAYLSQAAEELKSNRFRKAGMEENAQERYIRGLSDTQSARRIKRSQECGAWLMAMPSRLNGTELAALEFQDALRLLPPKDLPPECDGCGHALSCRKGGLVIQRHDDVAGEWHQLCAQALTPSRVTDEPIIPQGRITQADANGNRRTIDPLERAHGFLSTPKLTQHLRTTPKVYGRRFATIITGIRRRALGSLLIVTNCLHF
jgi:hypothetical protein